MPRSGVRNRANKGIDFPLYHTFAALPTSRDRIKGLFSYLCDYITFLGDSSILVFASFGIFVKLLTICSIPFERRAFFRLLRHRFVGFRRATAASARLAVSMRLSVFRINMLVELMSTT
ncbi:MAG: hypothetical protein ACLSVU_02380 [Christensenellales bacterium]